MVCLNDIKSRLKAFGNLKTQFLSNNRIVTLSSLLKVNDPVMRLGKWRVGRHDYSEDNYPNFCNGAGILLTREGMFYKY